MWMGRSPLAEGHSQNNSKEPQKQGAHGGKSGNWFNCDALKAFNPDEAKNNNKKAEVRHEDAQDEV